MDGITIIIPTTGKKSHLNALIKSIALQKMNQPVEILVLCNEDDDEVFSENENFAKTSADLKIIKLRPKGVNRARNRGISEARYKLLFFVDDDCELIDPLLLSKHFQTHQAKPDLFALGGNYAIPADTNFFSRLYQDIQMRWLFQSFLHSDRPQARYLIGGHFSAKRDLIQANSLKFNEAILYGGSELGFFEDAFQKSLNMELADLSVLHRTNETFLSLSKKVYKQGRGQALSCIEMVDAAKAPLVVRQKDGICESFFKSYLALVFKLGYLKQNKKSLTIFTYLFRNLKNNLLRIQYSLLDRLKNLDNSKKSRGDRF
jgi:glycosyltransferase involved in cell wall biosynthesis